MLDLTRFGLNSLDLKEIDYKGFLKLYLYLGIVIGIVLLNIKDSQGEGRWLRKTEDFPQKNDNKLSVV